MIFLVMFCVCICSLYYGVRNNEEPFTFFGIIGILGFGFLSIACILSGIGTYPSLVGERVEIMSIKSEIETVRNAYYKEANISNNVLINGSLDNMKQSKELSNYIRDYSYKKGKYNKSLITVKTRMSVTLYIIFGNRVFLDKRILELKPIE